jgi:hypothetical protein
MYTPTSDSSLHTTSTPDFSQSYRDLLGSTNINRPSPAASQGADCSPFSDPYYHQYQGPGFNTGIGAHLPRKSAQVPHHVPPYPASSDSVQGDGAGSGYQAMYSPLICPSQSGRSFADPSTESLQASMAQVIAEVKELAMCITSLSEREVEHSKIMNQLLTHTQAIEA